MHQRHDPQLNAQKNEIQIWQKQTVCGFPENTPNDVLIDEAQIVQCIQEKTLEKTLPLPLR